MAKALPLPSSSSILNYPILERERERERENDEGGGARRTIGAIGFRVDGNLPCLARIHSKA